MGRRNLVRFDESLRYSRNPGVTQTGVSTTGVRATVYNDPLRKCLGEYGTIGNVIVCFHTEVYNF